MRVRFDSKIQKIVVCAFISMFISFPILAKTSFSVVSSETNITIPTASLSTAAGKFDDFLNPAMGNLANGAFFSCTAGYPVGSVNIEPFPHFITGLTLGAGLSSMSYLETKNKNDLPGGGMSGGLLFGTGIKENMDIVGKIFYFNSMFYDINKIPGMKAIPFELEDVSLFSIGAKIRTKKVGEKRILPFLFDLAGVTMSVGGDLTNGSMKVGADTSYKLNLGKVTVSDPAPKEVNMTYEVSSANMKIKWVELAVTAEALAHFKVVKIFTLYTGFSATVGYGWVYVKGNVTGDVTGDVNLAAVSAGDSFAVLKSDTESRYSPYPWLPAYKIGLQLELPYVKLTGDTSVNLYNKEDITFTVGTLFEI